MADASSTSPKPNKETVTLRLPSGEMVDAIVPAGFSDADLKGYVRMKRPDLFGAPTSGASMPGGPSTQPQMQQVGLLTGKPSMSTRFGEALEQTSNPGFTEGPGLNQALAGWSSIGPGQMGQGAADLARGNLARGGHEVLSGGMNTLAPTTPLVAPAAGVGGLIRALLGGTAGGYVAQQGAQALGANPDQTALAGDIGTLAGGYGAGKAELGPRSKAVATLAAKDLASHVPVAGRLVRRPSILDYVKAVQTKATPESPVEIPSSKVSTTPPESVSRSSQLQQSKALQNVPVSAVQDKSAILGRMQQIAQQPGTGVTVSESNGPPLRIAGQDVPANTNLAPALKASLPQNRIQGKIMQVLRREGPNLTIGMDRLMEAPELKGISREQVQTAAKSLRDSGKVWGHEARAAGEESPSIYGIALKKR